MPATITAFNTFVAGQKAKAGEVNQNFDNFRGDRIPINANTTTASTNTHDLGVSSHRWKDIHGAVMDLLGSTSTTDLSIRPDVSVTAGAFDMRMGTQTIMSVTPTAISMFMPGGATAVSFDSQGMARNFVKKVGETTGNFITNTSFVVDEPLTTGVYLDVGLSITAVAVSDSTFFFSFSHREATAGVTNIGMASISAHQRPIWARIGRGSTVVQAFVLTGASNASHYLTNFSAIDSPNTAGSVTYHVSFSLRTSDAATTSVNIANTAMKLNRI